MKLNALLATVFATFALASPGEWLDEFMDCDDACNYQLCGSYQANPSRYSDIAFSLPTFPETLLLWDCKSNCDYQCQQIIVAERERDGQEIYQFHGKWPFKRVLLTQELWSTLFSIGNFIPHYQGFWMLKREYQRRHNLLIKNYMIVALAGCCAWFCSTIFHIRDTLVTEHLDYFFAGATVLAGFHAITIRVTRMDRIPNIRKLFSWTVAAILTLHILRLLIDWSYTYNMRFNVAFGVLQYVMLLLLAYRNYLNDKPKKLVFTPLALVLSTSLAMSCELFDFFHIPTQLDAHAVWHFCTIWPSFYLYDFFAEDSRSA